MMRATMTRLRDLGDWSGGNTPSKANAAYWTDGTIPWVSPKDMKVDEITSSEDRVSQAALKLGRVSMVPEGSVLVVTRSGILAHTLPVAVTKTPVTINQDLKALTPKPGVLPKYVAHALRGASRRILKECSKHGTTVASVETNALLDFEIPLVDLDEQCRIVAELEKQFSRLDEAVANLKRVKANLDRYVGATLGEAFSGKWAGTEADWQSVPLREVADVQLGQQRAPVHAADANPIPYVRAANVSWQGLDLSDVKSMGFPNAARYRLAYGDILLAEASGSANEVGKPAIWRDEIPGACYQKTLIRVRCQPDRLNFEFAYYFFLHAALSGQFARLAPGVGILHLTAERMLVWPTVAPTLRIQAVVVSEVDRRLSTVREVEAEVDANLMRAQALRQAVLAKAFAA
ncbi:MAG: restriction endonuclease subunit S [Accumulibacter sp.]|jgi:type I restriction enzyme S subunit